MVESFGREDENAAIMMMAALNTLIEKGESDPAASLLVKHLQHFVDAKFPQTESSNKLREKMVVYTKDSEAFKSTNSQSEDGARQPATAPKLKFYER